jgi:sec-independent protein translocase protein TatC
MVLSPLLKLRDKLTRKRHALTEDVEKPFLEHLDDLRKMFMRIIITLIVAVIACFVFHPWFFQVVKHPLRAAGLLDPKERNLPAAVAALKSDDQQPTWWRIHGAARGIADLDGAQREVFLQFAATDDLTRQMAYALLFYHAADALPTDAREGYLKAAAALLPAEDTGKVVEYAAQLTSAKTDSSLDKPHDFVETEAFGPAETFMLSMKLSLFAGIIVSFPLLFFFLLEFILPGLTSRERKLMFPALSIGFGLFLAGVLFAFFFVIPRALLFFHEYGVDLGIKDRWRIGLYISFVVSFTLIFGFAFELPVVVMVMVKLGLLSAATMRRTRGWAVVIILIASAVLTPTGDALTMSLLGAPMILMYEVCIWLAWFHERRERRRDEEERRQDQARRAALIGVASVPAAHPGESSAPGGESAAPDAESRTEAADSAAVTYPVHDDAHPDGAELRPPDSHHPDGSGTGSDADSEYEQYLRDHAHLYSPTETHPEAIPAEERAEPAPAEAVPVDEHPEPPPAEAPPSPDAESSEAQGNAASSGDAGARDNDKD